jgi:apolipoprotein N-acyltransferase
VGVAAFVARAVGMTGIVQLYGDVLPLPALVATITLVAGIYAGVVLLTRWTAREAPPALAVFTYPLLLVCSEWSFGLVSPHGAFGAMGHALVDVLPLLQMASLGGLPALTFCVALVPMALAVALATPAAARRASIAGGIPLLLAMGFGIARLSQDYQGEARVALIGLDRYEAAAYGGDSADLAVAREFAALIKTAASAHPDYIVLPEKQLGGARVADGSAALLAQAAAAAAPATVIAGFDEVIDGDQRVNSAQVLVPGQPLRRYIKRRLIPGVEQGYVVGGGSFVEGTRGVAICKDMDFPRMIRDYGRREVELMLVPAWDFVADGRLHARMALIRGVENGFALARAATAGRLTVSDRYGRVIAEAITSPEQPVTLVADVGLRGGATLYARVGDAFAWLCAASTLGLLTWRLRRRTVAS